MDEGVTEPVEDSRSFAEKQADELYQQEEGFKNAKKLLDDPGEANKLIKTLIENNMLFDFNSNFPRIFREIKSNYGDVGSFDAFRLIRKLLKEVANQDADKPLNNKDF